VGTGHRSIASRRSFIAGLAALAAGPLLAACQPQTVEKIVTQVVEKPVEKIVEKEKVVTQVVEKEKVVTQVVEKEKVVVATAAPQTVKGVSIVMWGLQYDPHVEAYQRLAKLYNQRTGGEVIVQPQTDLGTKAIAAIAAGTGPDVECWLGKNLMPMHLRKLLVDCTDLFKEMGQDIKKGWAPDAIGAYSYAGKIWGVPQGFGWGVGAMVVEDQGAIKKLGLNAPPANGKENWDSYDLLWETGKALMVSEGGKVKTWGVSSAGWSAQSYLGILVSLGTPFYKDGKFNINSDQGVKAMQLLIETPVKMGIESYLNMNQVDAWMQGKVALARGNGIPLVEAKKKGFDPNIAFAPAVGGKITDQDPHYVSEAGWGMIGFKASKKQDAVREYLKMNVDTSGQEAFCLIYGGELPARSDVATEKFMSTWDPLAAEVAKRGLKGLQRYSFYTEYGEDFGYIGDLEKHVNAGCDSVLQGKATPAEAVKSIQTNLEASQKTFQEDVKKVNG